tara:strand:- start:195 stop:614 length:420 start_codon:yes stop_codon:yes gene_type:complete
MLDIRHKMLDNNSPLKRWFKVVLLFGSTLFISSCAMPKNTEKQEEIIPIATRVINSETIKTFTGCWVYGERQHIFKDEATLEEYDLVFPNENMEELVELYLAVCEMEYLPMECEMKGTLNGNTLTVQAFEILYIQGCGE